MPTLQTAPLFLDDTEEERLPPIGKEVFLSLSDEEKYHHFFSLFHKAQDLDEELQDAREGLHQLQIDLAQSRELKEENRKQAEILAEQTEQIAFLQLEREGWEAKSQDALLVLQNEISTLQQTASTLEEEKQQLLEEKEQYESDLKILEEKGQKSALLDQALEDNKTLRNELQKIKEIVLQGLKEAKELKIKATSALQEKAELERNASRLRAEAEALKRERGHFEEMLRRLKSENQHLLPKLKDELDATRKELDQAKISLANRVKEATLLQEKQEEDRVNYLERIKILEDRLHGERSQRDAEIARLAGGEELLLRLSPHIAALHKMVVDKGKEETFEHDASTPSLFDSIQKHSNERLF